MCACVRGVLQVTSDFEVGHVSMNFPSMCMSFTIHMQWKTALVGAVDVCKDAEGGRRTLCDRVCETSLCETSVADCVLQVVRWPEVWLASALELLQASQLLMPVSATFQTDAVRRTPNRGASHAMPHSVDGRRHLKRKAPPDSFTSEL
jgi:hypothetical protein